MRLQTFGGAVLALVLALALAAVAGCATSQDAETTSSLAVGDSLAADESVVVDDGAASRERLATGGSEASGESVASGDARGEVSVPAVAATAVAEAGEYRIGPLDVLEISVFDVPDLGKEAQVNAKGDISMPLIGPIRAAGRTTRELEVEIAAKLGADYLQSPEVSVSVKEYTSQRITVDGAVKGPGVFATTGRTTLLQAIALAQGLDRVADPRGIVVFRTVDGERKAAKFDLVAIRAGTTVDPVVQGGDVIVVDQSGGKTAMRSLRESIGIFGLFMPFL